MVFLMVLRRMGLDATAHGFPLGISRLGGGMHELSQRRL
jgi:hypothetical protein